MIEYLTNERISEIMETEEANEEIFGVLFSDGESKDCIQLKEAIQLSCEHNGEVYLVR